MSIDKWERERLAIYACVQILEDDLGVLITVLHEKDSPAARREFVRAVFAYFEAGLAFYADSLLDGHSHLWQLSCAERMLISERVGSVTDSGKVRERAAPLPFPNRARFLMRRYQEVHESPLDAGFTDNGWERLTRAIVVRNRLTHPKRDTDLLVSDEELADVHAARHWWAMAMVRLLAGSNRFFEQLEQGPPDN